MKSRQAPATSKVLAEIQMMFIAELVETPAGQPIRLDRRYVAILQAALGEIIGQVEVLEEGAAAADRLTAEMAILRADRERWRRAAETYHDAWGREVDHKAARAARAGTGGDVVDLVEILRRERRDAGRPIGPEGGAA